MTANAPVQVRHGRKIVEIVSTEVSKGMAASRILDHLPDGEQPALVLCAGDDATDESLFTLACDDLLSIKVGGGPTAARHRAADPAAFRRFLMGALGGTANAS